MRLQRLLPTRNEWFLAAIFLFQGHLFAEEIRTWSDNTGRFKIEAKFVARNEGKIKLERSDGRLFEIDLLKLSKADQDFLKELEKNPFQATDGDNPFVPAKENASSPAMETTKPGGAGPVNWSHSQYLDLDSFGDGWNFQASESAELNFVPKAVELPKRVEFFEKMQSLAINREAQKAVIGYLWTFATKEKGPQSRIVMCDLAQGTVTSAVSVGAEMVPMALHPDGKTVLMKSAERNQDALEFWTIQGRNVERGERFQSHNDAWGRQSEVQWARFADAETLVMKHSNGWVSLWDLQTRQPVCHFAIEGGCTPALTGDGQVLAFYKQERVGLLELATRNVIAMQKSPRRLNWPHFAFSPSENRLACVAFNSILVWSTETGELYRDFETPGIHINTAPHFSDDDFLLVGGRYLVELENMIKLWDYEGAEQVKAVGGTTFFAVSPQNRPGALMPTLIPHESAMQALDAALNEPDLFVFREGVSVRLDVEGIPAAHRTQVEENLRSSLDKMNIQIDVAAPLTVKASISGPKQEQMNYTRSGTYTVQVYRTLLEFVYGGTTIWQSSGTNIPHFVSIGAGENLGDILKEKSKGPAYGFYQSVVLPKFVQKPQGNTDPGRSSGQTLGVSKVVPTTMQSRPGRTR